jgi:hypothetical protein
MPSVRRLGACPNFHYEGASPVRPTSFMVRLTMRKIVGRLAVAASVLSGLPFGGMAAETVAIPASGTWINVTPSGVDLVNALSCENFGSITMVADPARPSDLYTQFHCQGVWKSVDYGPTWFGPINTGQGGAGASGAGGLAIARGSGWTASNPIFGWHPRHWCWLLEVQGRRPRMDQLSRGAWW